MFLCISSDVVSIALLNICGNTAMGVEGFVLQPQCMVSNCLYLGGKNVRELCH